MIPHAILKEASTLTAAYVKEKLEKKSQEFIDALDIEDVDVLPEKVKFELGKLLALAYRDGYLNHYESTQRKKILM
jgi:hypothetical protein